MFQSIQFFVDQTINVDEILASLVAIGYRHAKSVVQEGDFSRRGEIIDIFPVNYDSPIRIALDEDRIRSIASFNVQSGKTIWEHKIVIILPHKPTERAA